MKHNWQKTVNEINRNRYSIPEGWDTKDQVATNLQCAPERVSDILKPGIQSGDIEKQDFPVWDDKRRMTVRISCYRVKPDKAAPSESKGKPEKQPTKTVKSPSLRNRIVACIEKNAGWDDARVAKSFKGCNSTMVRELRSTL